jgi:hypothetical protein
MMPQAHPVSAAPPPLLKPLLFSSSSVRKLRPLLQFGQQQQGALSPASSPYPSPSLSLSNLFSLKQSGSLSSGAGGADLLLPGLSTVALVVVQDAELQWTEQRKQIVAKYG